MLLDLVMSNTPHFSQVTLRDITKRCKFSLATVSRALRDDPRVNKETVRKIKDLAKKMGYRPNPMINSLMAAHKRRRPRQELIANICWLNTHPEKNFWHDHPYTKHLIKAAQDRAHELGYGFEEIWTSEPGLTSKRLHQIAHSRYVQGVLVPGPVKNLMDGGFEWEKYAVVCIRERQLGQLEWHRCNASARKNVQIAFTQLRRLGYRRIAYAGGVYLLDSKGRKEMERFNKGQSEESGFLLQGSLRVQLAGFMYSQAFVKKADRIWPYLFDNQAGLDLKLLAGWLKRARPEAVIANGIEMHDAAKLAGLKIPKDVAMAHTNLDEDVAGWAGIDAHQGRQARAAVDMLCAQIERNERGLPYFPKYMHIEGEWRDGWTAPKIN